MKKIKISVVISPNNLNDYKNYIQQKIFSDLINHTIPDVGTISSVNNIDHISQGLINQCGSCIFTIFIDANITQISVYDVLYSRISSITSHGFYIHLNNQEIFSLFDENVSESDIQIADSVKVVVTKVKYDIITKKYIIIAKYLNNTLE